MVEKLLTFHSVSLGHYCYQGFSHVSQLKMLTLGVENFHDAQTTF